MSSNSWTDNCMNCCLKIVQNRKECWGHQAVFTKWVLIHKVKNSMTIMSKSILTAYILQATHDINFKPSNTGIWVNSFGKIPWFPGQQKSDFLKSKFIGGICMQNIHLSMQNILKWTPTLIWGQGHVSNCKLLRHKKILYLCINCLALAQCLYFPIQSEECDIWKAFLSGL